MQSRLRNIKLASKILQTRVISTVTMLSSTPLLKSYIKRQKDSYEIININPSRTL
jgi:hypothetical protein